MHTEGRQADNINTVDPRKMWGLGAPTTCAVENSHCWTLHILKILYKEARVRGHHARRPGASILNLKEYKAPLKQTNKQKNNQKVNKHYAGQLQSLPVWESRLEHRRSETKGEKESRWVRWTTVLNSGSLHMGGSYTVFVTGWVWGEQREGSL